MSRAEFRFAPISLVVNEAGNYPREAPRQAVFSHQ